MSVKFLTVIVHTAFFPSFVAAFVNCPMVKVGHKIDSTKVEEGRSKQLFRKPFTTNVLIIKSSKSKL